MSPLATSPVATLKSGCAPTLSPKMAPWMQHFIKSEGLAARLVAKYGSPLHVLVRSEFERNVIDLLEPLKERGLSGGLWFARKANKLPWFVSAAKDCGIGVDTASFREVEETLELGVSPDKVIVTAVGKDKRIIEKAIANGCLLVIDNFDELEMIERISRSLQKDARVGLRFAGFTAAGKTVYSRFGFPEHQAPQIIDRLNDIGNLKLELLHAHLDKYDIQERAVAAARLLELVDYARSKNHQVRSIDIGGGILMRYLDDESQWMQFTSALAASVKGEIESFTFQNDGFGYTKVGNDLVGVPNLYPMWNTVSKERFIAAVLDQEPGGVPLHKQIRDREVSLFFEPGRALLDNTGITLGEVRFRKQDSEGNHLIGIGMNRMNLRPFRAEFCSDPIFLASAERQPATDGMFIVGCLCSESDFLMRRRLQLPFVPQAEDIACFINTAGYLAHHMEIGTHGDPIPTNILLDPSDWAVREVLS